ncbi:hypothetical protein ACHAXT_005216 [Thalassiosira profunda]
MCLIVRNETIYMDEWADFHISLGFAPIYIYDNADLPDLGLQAWLERRRDLQHLVHITHMPVTPVQVYAYERCLRHDAANNTFAAPIDIDEFIVLHKHENVLDFLADHCGEDCGQISINWKTMGTSNEDRYRPLPVTKRNVNEHTFKPLRRVIKVILRPTYIDDNIDWSHSVNLKRGHWVDTSGTTIERALSYGPTKGRPPYEYAGPTDVAEIYHYRFKSEEEFVAKNCVRGDSLQRRGDNPKCANLNKPQNYPRTGGAFDDAAWRQLKRMCPNMEGLEQANRRREGRGLIDGGMTAGAPGAALEAATDRRKQKRARPPQTLRASAAAVPSGPTCPLTRPPAASATARAMAASNATPRHLSEYTAETAAITGSETAAIGREGSKSESPPRLPRLIIATAPKRLDEPAGLTLQHRGRARANSAQPSTSSAQSSAKSAKSQPPQGTSGTTGVVISAVSPQSPFHPANALSSDALQKGDEVLTVNGRRVRDPRRAARMIRSAGGSGHLTVLVSRGARPEGTRYHLARVGGSGGGKEGNGGGKEGSRWKESKLDEPSRWKEAKDGSIANGEDTDGGRNACGVDLQASTNSTLVRVKSVREESPFRKTGLRAGDIVLSVDGIPIRSANDAEDLLYGKGDSGNPTPRSSFARSVQTGHDGSRVVALLVHSLRDLRRRVLTEALLPHEGTTNITTEEATAASEGKEEGGSAAAVASIAPNDGATASAASGGVAGGIGESRRPMHPPVDEDGSSPTCSSRPLPAPSDAPGARSRIMAEPSEADDAGEPSGEAWATEPSEDGPWRPGLPRDALTRVRLAAKETSAQIAARGNGKCEHRPEPTDPHHSSLSMAPVAEEGKGTVEPRPQARQNGNGVRGSPAGDLRRRPSFVPVYAKRRRSAGTVPSASTESESESSDGETGSDSSSYASSTSGSEESAEELPRPAKKQGHSPRQRRPRRATTPPRQLAAPVSDTTDLVVYNPESEAADHSRRNSAPVVQPPQPHHKHRLKLRHADVRRRYKVLPAVLGAGAFGTVRACFRRGTRERLAVKSIPKRGNGKHAALLKNEIALVQRADHPNVVKVHDVVQDKEYIHIVMEECRGGDLFDRIVEGGVRLTEERACEIVGTLLDALAYLHDRSIVHRDLKAEHLMLSRDDIRSPVKIIDFGLATIHGPNDPPMTAFAGSAFTVAPEVIARKYGKECDLWSVGVITYFLLTQKMPFNARSDNDIFQKIVRCDYGYPPWAERGLSEAAKDFIDRLLVVDPRRRLTARQALSHVWIRRQNKRHEASSNSLELALVPVAEEKAIVLAYPRFYADLQILEQQRQESERKVASAQLARKQKLEQKSALDRRLCELKSQNGGMRAELHRAANQLALKHRELLEAQGRSEEGRKRLNKFDVRLKRAVGVARLLPGYKARVEHLVRQLNEKEARLNFAKGQVLSKLQSAMVRRDDARHRHELLVKAINANAVKERSIAEDITRIRSEIASNEQDLSAAQQMESQTKLRVETIEHEVSMERTRHAGAVSDLESKAKEMDDAKGATARAIEEKKAAIEAKKQQLSEMFAKCNELRKAEGHDTFPEPKWGEEQPPSLDVARVRVRVAAEEKALEAKKAERDALRKDVADLDATIASNAAKAAEKQAEAEALMKEAAAAREVEAQRKADMEKMVAEADVECEEVEKLRASIGELTATKEAHAEEVKSKLEGEQGTVSAMDAEIATTLEEIAAVEKAKSEHEEKEGAEKQAIVAEIAKAKSLADIVKGAYEQAQKKADNFAALPDDELAMELKQLDEEEKQIIEEADRERDEMIEQEPVLEHVKLDWNSDIPIEEQKEAGMTYMRQHCHDFLETAKAERQVRGAAKFFEEKAREEAAEETRLAADKRRKKGAADERRRKKEAAEEKRRAKEAARLAEKAKLKKAKEEEEKKTRLRREARKQKEIEERRQEKEAADAKRKKEEERAAKRKAEEKAHRRKEEERRIEEELEEEKRLEELPYNERKSHQLEDMRMRSQKMHELLKSEEESINKERKEKSSRSRKEAEQQKKLKDDAKKREEANKRRSSKSNGGGERERSKSRGRTSKPDGKENKTKRSRSTDTRESSSGRAKSVLKSSKNSKRPRTSSASVRFEETASRPKLDIFASTKGGKKKNRKSSSSKLSQTSGESTLEGGRRRKRPSSKSKGKSKGKSKAKALSVVDMGDDGGGFNF